MKAVKPILLISGIGIIAYAIYNYYKKQFKLLADVQTTLVGLKIVSVSKTAVVLDITSRITNISNVEATVKQMYLDCFLNGVLIGNVNEIKDISILAGKSSDIPFRFTFNPSLILGNVVNILTPLHPRPRHHLSPPPRYALELPLKWLMQCKDNLTWALLVLPSELVHRLCSTNSYCHLLRQW